MHYPDEPPPLPDPETEGVMRLSRLAIDQVILDGMVDGLEQRAPWGALTTIAFQRTKNVPPPTLETFREGLVSDERFIDEVDKSYGYKPVINGPTDMRPRPAGIVKGTPWCTEEERQEVLDRMERYAQALFEYNPTRPLPLKHIRLLLKELGLTLSNLEFDGFRAFMREDPRFIPLHSGLGFKPAKTEPDSLVPDDKDKQSLDKKINKALTLPEGERWRRGDPRTAKKKGRR